MKAARYPCLLRLYAVGVEDPICILTERMPHRSLLHYLHDVSGRHLSLRPLIEMIAQINTTAPKAALSGRFTVKSDVWSFGITIYEIITDGQIPYPSMNNTETLNQVSTGYRMPRPANCSEGVYEIMLQTWGATPERRPPFEYLRTYFEEYFVSPEPPGLFPDALSLRRADKMASMDTGENLGIMCIEPGESFESEEEEELVDAELMNLARNMANQINGNHHSHQQNHVRVTNLFELR
ncbi:hypothetical protein ACTXT7_016712 [Hymenolepis weldensis]